MSKNRTLIILGFFIQFTTMAFGRFAYTLVYPDMMNSLALSHTAMSMLGTGIVAGYLLNSHISGWLSNRIGAHQTVCISIFLSSLSLFILGYVSRFSVLLAASFVLGASASGAYVPLIHILNRETGGKAAVFGFVMGGAGAGILMSGYLIPFVLTHQPIQGYRTTWYTLSLINVVVLALSLAFFRKELHTDGYTAARLKREGRLVPVLYRHRRLQLVLLAYFFVGFSYIIYVTFFGAYTVDELGFTIRSTGAMWSLFGINTIYSGIIWGVLSDRYDKTDMGIFSLLTLLLSVFIVTVGRQELLFYISTFLFGFSFMGVLTVIISIISDLVPEESMSMVFGFSTLVHGGAQALSTPIAGSLKDVTGTFRVSFILSCAGTGIGILIFTILKAIQKQAANRADDAGRNIPIGYES